MGSSCSSRKNTAAFNLSVRPVCEESVRPVCEESIRSNSSVTSVDEGVAMRFRQFSKDYVTPLNICSPNYEFYDPKKEHENYITWAKIRFDAPSATAVDFPDEPTDVGDIIQIKCSDPTGISVREMDRSVMLLNTRYRGSMGDGEYRCMYPPPMLPGELWTDSSFPKEVAMAGLPDVHWLRPKDICPHPVLFSDGSCRYDVGQGSAGTCWLLSILAALSEKPAYLTQILGPDAYPINTSRYDGTFHCRLWSLGAWQEVFVDDFLPVCKETNKLWGAHSAANENEMWVALMEKTFARFFGSYSHVIGGYAGDAFVSLTGGVQEDLRLEVVHPLDFFKRMEKAMEAGAIVACSVPAEFNQVKGLAGGHAYTITDTGRVSKLPNKGKTLPLLRIRNPWGTGEGEWKGPWSYGTRQWSGVSSSDKGKLKYETANNGEFWISLKDFYAYFWRTFICNFTPDFTRDGTPDGLTHEWTILGDFLIDNLGKYKKTLTTMHDLTTMPRYTICLRDPEQGLRKPEDPDYQPKNIPTLIQFVQQNSASLLYIRVQLFRVEQQWQLEENNKYLLLHDISEDKTFIGANDVTYRYLLLPGMYVLMPTYSKLYSPLDDRKFCLRIFATQRMNVRMAPWNEYSHIFLNNMKYEFLNEAGEAKFFERQFFPGEWRGGFNAGGQACRGRFSINPQISMVITGTEEMRLGIDLSQEICSKRVALGIDIFKLPFPEIELPVKEADFQIDSDITQCGLTVGGDFLFMHGNDVNGHFILPPGNYVIVLFSDIETDEQRFVVTVATERKTKCVFYQGRQSASQVRILTKTTSALNQFNLANERFVEPIC